MTEWLHELNGVEIEEPVGFNDIVFNIQRDEIWHGVFFEASTSQLGFYDAAFDILQSAKENDGVDAVVIYKASSRCEGETEYTEVINGKLDFSGYQELCGDQCLIRLSVEQDNCAMIFKNRFDQKVDIDTALGFDKITTLVDYPGLRFDMMLATQVIPITADADVSLDSDTGVLTDTVFDAQINSQVLFIRPLYTRVTDNSIMTGELDDPTNVFEDPDGFFLISPQVLIGENPKCITTGYDYEVRMKGSIILNYTSSTPGAVMRIRLIVDVWNGTGSHRADATVLHAFTVDTSADSGVTYTFDQLFSGSTNLLEGDGFYAYIEVAALPVNIVTCTTTYIFDPETSFFLDNTKECPETNCEVGLIFETLARATEVITNRCLTIDSEYYGRTDSEPYSYDEDGCGSLRILTPGLRIRQATDKNFFASMKDFMFGLRAIDNIGMGMLSDRIRIEPAEYFYQDVMIMEMLLIPTSVSKIDQTLIYSNIKTGYNKWEIKSIKGIDEFCSYKERRTGIESVNNELDISCDLIAGGYPIENLRTQSLGNTGLTDSTYDNDVFIICVDRDAYGYHVEQGITEDASQFFSPATAYNWRIRPLYNIMRWFKSIAQCYVNVINTPASKIFFTQGKGNYLAKGNISPYDPCTIESRAMPENEDIAHSDFKNSADGTPIYKPETIAFTYPLSIAEYYLIKATPYGYINVQCGANGPIQKTFIKTIEYKPAEGSAEFVLLKSWL
jgi:hypothetical protein